MLVEVEILPPPEDTRDPLLDNPGPFLMVHKSDNKGMKTNAAAVRIVSKSYGNDEWHMAAPASADPMGKIVDTESITDNYVLLPNDFRIILTQRI